MTLGSVCNWKAGRDWAGGHNPHPLNTNPNHTHRKVGVVVYIESRKICKLF